MQSGASCRAACSPGRLARRSEFLLEWCCGESDRHLLDGVAALRGDAEMRRGRGGDPVRWGGLAQRSEARQHLRALNDAGGRASAAGRARRVHGGVEANRIAHSRRRRRARACVWHGGHGGRGRRCLCGCARGVGERTCENKGHNMHKGGRGGRFFLVFLGGLGGTNGGVGSGRHGGLDDGCCSRVVGRWTVLNFWAHCRHGHIANARPLRILSSCPQLATPDSHARPDFEALASLDRRARPCGDIAF